MYGAKWARQHLAATGCDILIAVYGLDDILLKPETYTYQRDQLESVKLGGYERGRVKQFLVDVSQICRRISHSRQRRSLAQNLGRWRERNFYAKALARERAIYSQLPIKYEFARLIGQDPAREYVDGLSSLAATAQANNAVFLAVGEPTLHSGVMGPAEERLVHRWFVADPKAGEKGVFRMDSGRIELELGRYFSAAQEACQSLGVPFVNTQRQFPPNAIIFVDDVQFTDDGAVGLRAAARTQGQSAGRGAFEIAGNGHSRSFRSVADRLFACRRGAHGALQLAFCAEKSGDVYSAHRGHRCVAEHTRGSRSDL